MSITFILNLFLLQTACGMIALCLLLPKDRVDRYFFKSIAFFTYLFIGAALVMRYYYPFQLPSNFGITVTQVSYTYVNALYGLIAVCAFVAWVITRFTDERPFRLWLNAASLLAVPAVICDSLLFIPTEMALGLPTFLVPIHFVTASLLLGGFLIGMIFGHWYLINVDMPKRLLVRMSWILSATLILKILAVGGTWLWIYQTAGPEAELVKLLTSFGGYGIFFWQRILIGLAIPAIIAYMVWSTARIGSNQSATGIMYVGVAFIFIGELVAKFLFLFSTIPL